MAQSIKFAAGCKRENRNPVHLKAARDRLSSYIELHFYIAHNVRLFGSV